MNSIIIALKNADYYNTAMLPLGVQGENGVTEVRIDFTEWALAFDDGLLSVRVDRADGAPTYAPVLSVEGTVAIWTVTNVDTGASGTGRVQFVYQANDVQERSCIFNTYVAPSLGEPGEAPDPYADLIERMAELATQASQSAADAEAASEAIQDMDVAAEDLPAGSDYTVTKVVDPVTGAVTLLFGFPPPGSTTSYATLTHKPRINGVELTENKTSADLGIDQTYKHVQSVASDAWEITHNLGKYPSVTVVDSAGSVVVGEVRYLNDDSLVVTFSGAFRGVAYLN